MSTISHRGLLFFWRYHFFLKSLCVCVCVVCWIVGLLLSWSRSIFMRKSKATFHCVSRLAVLHFWWNSNSKVKWKYLLSAISSIFVIPFDQHKSNDFSIALQKTQPSSPLTLSLPYVLQWHFKVLTIWAATCISFVFMFKYVWIRINFHRFFSFFFVLQFWAFHFCTQFKREITGKKCLVCFSFFFFIVVVYLLIVICVWTPE